MSGYLARSLLLVSSAMVLVPSHAADDAAQQELGKKLFTQLAVPSCALCHTLKDAGTNGAVGPVLDELQPDAQRVVTALKNGIGSMPSFKNNLSEVQIQALAKYVEKATGAAK